MEFDWPVIFLSIACVCNSFCVVCLNRSISYLRNRQAVMEREIVQLMNRQRQLMKTFTEEGAVESEFGVSAKHIGNDLHEGGSKTSST